jgi:hypothetical protein
MDVVAADGVITGTISGATLNASYDDPVNLVNDDPGNTSAAVMWLDSTGALRIKVATSTTTPPTPSSETDGDQHQRHHGQLGAILLKEPPAMRLNRRTVLATAALLLVAVGAIAQSAWDTRTRPMYITGTDGGRSLAIDDSLIVDDGIRATGAITGSNLSGTPAAQEPVSRCHRPFKPVTLTEDPPPESPWPGMPRANGGASTN